MRKKMHETEYRASRICRVMGNPTAYQIVKLLLGCRKKPSEIAQELGLSITLVSFTLRNLRNIDLVRYDTNGNEKVYWVKQDILSEICTQLETLVGEVRQKQW